jgi:D-3-phosphoglycerate dehydrogenase
LYEALTNDSIAGAALDVFEVEPLPDDRPLARLPNVVCTPHVAGQAGEAMARVSRRAAETILSVLRGQTPAPELIANPEVLTDSPRFRI